jgi:hypothetical protein
MACRCRRGGGGGARIGSPVHHSVAQLSRSRGVGRDGRQQTGVDADLLLCCFVFQLGRVGYEIQNDFFYTRTYCTSYTKEHLERRDWLILIEIL